MATFTGFPFGATRGVDTCPDMIALAESNNRDYGFEERTQYIEGDGQKLPFDDGTFNAVFAATSLHEWDEPEQIFEEINQILKGGGLYFVSDLCLDVSLPIRWCLYLASKPKEIRPGLVISLKAAYTRDEVEVLLQRTSLRGAKVKKNPFGLRIVGRKPA